MHFLFQCQLFAVPKLVWQKDFSTNQQATPQVDQNPAKFARASAFLRFSGQWLMLIDKSHDKTGWKHLIFPDPCACMWDKYQFSTAASSFGADSSLLSPIRTFYEYKRVSLSTCLSRFDQRKRWKIKKIQNKKERNESSNQRLCKMGMVLISFIDVAQRNSIYIFMYERSPFAFSSQSLRELNSHLKSILIAITITICQFSVT